MYSCEESKNILTRQMGKLVFLEFNNISLNCEHHEKWEEL